MELQNLATALKAAQPAAEGAAPQLIYHVEQTAQTLWNNMKSAFASVFEMTLEKMKWPGKDLTLTSNLRQEWSTGVENLLQLQNPYVESAKNLCPRLFIFRSKTPVVNASRSMTSFCFGVHVIFPGNLFSSASLRLYRLLAYL